MGLLIRRGVHAIAMLAAIFLLVERAAASDGTPMDMPDPVPPGMGVVAGSLVVDCWRRPKFDPLVRLVPTEI